MDPLPVQTGGSGSTLAAESTKKYARWRDVERRTFIAACESAIADGHRHGKCFTKIGWERVSTLFNQTTGHNWSKLQLRNHWDAMRREHKRLTELLNCTGVEYNESTGKIVASEEWWTRKIKENKDYKDFKNKDVSEIHVKYCQLFGDSYDGDKYAVTPTKLCRTGFNYYEDSAVDDLRDSIPVAEESTGSSDEGPAQKSASSMQTSNARSGEKRRSGSSRQKGKKKKVSAKDLSYSVDRATSAAAEVAAKLNAVMEKTKNAGVACVEELLAAGKIQRCTPIYYFACTLLAQKKYRDMLDVMQTIEEKFGWIEWQFNRSEKSLP